MKETTENNVQIKLKKTPTVDYPKTETDVFQTYEVSNFNANSINVGEVAIRNQYVSIDASMRVWISGSPSYTDPVDPGMVMNGRSVGVVINSKSQKFSKGDFVFANGGWQKYCIKQEKQLVKIPKYVKNPQVFLALAISGPTAIFGLERVGQIKQNQIVVVSAAAGGAGHLTVQYAKLKGCIVCGIAGGQQKCNFVKSLGADYIIDYKKQSVKDKLREYFKHGIDVYFDNVGGEILDDVLMNIKDQSRIVSCGAVSNYSFYGDNQNKNEYYRLKNYPRLIIKRAVMKGFIVLDYMQEFPQAYQQLFSLIDQGKLKVMINLFEGIEQCPNALVKLLRGQTMGKVLVKISKLQAKL